MSSSFNRFDTNSIRSIILFCDDKEADEDDVDAVTKDDVAFSGVCCSLCGVLRQLANLALKSFFMNSSKSANFLFKLTTFKLVMR